MAAMKRPAPAAPPAGAPPAKRVKWTLEPGTKRVIPKGLPSKKIQRCFIEFIDIDARDSMEEDFLNDNGERTNHCILSFVFANPGLTHAPANTLGVTVDLSYEPLGGVRATERGHFKIATIHNLGHHPYAAKVVEVPVNHGLDGKRFSDFLAVIHRNDMLPCGFNSENVKGVVGCRDFMSQFLYRLNEANIFTVTPDIYLNFNTNYGPGTSTRAGGVGYAAFNDTYHAKHVAIAGVRYLGNHIPLDLDGGDNATMMTAEVNDTEMADADDSDSAGCTTS